MSPLAGILAFAALFAVFGFAERHRTRRSCGSCQLDARDNACSTCPLYEAKHD